MNGPARLNELMLKGSPRGANTSTQILAPARTVSSVGSAGWKWTWKWTVTSSPSPDHWIVDVCERLRPTPFSIMTADR